MTDTAVADEPDDERPKNTVDELARIRKAMANEGVDISEVDPMALPGTDARKPADRRWLLGKLKEDEFLLEFKRNGLDLEAACLAVNWSRSTYKRHRRDPRFAHAVDAIRGSSSGRPSRREHTQRLADLLTETIDDLAEKSALPRDQVPLYDHLDTWDGFAGFRKLFFKHDSAWFHLRIVEVLENAKPGEITLILMPPEHGKTTILEDWIGMKLALDPTFRIVYASEKQNHARKVIKRCKNRMHPDGPAQAYVARFGPFVPQTGEDARPQPWNQDYFDVWSRMGGDERDYNMVGLGMGSAVAGTRCDLLVVDDAQSLKSINQTDKIFDEFRQDWLSRPGSKGRTVILGTRVGDDDFYQRLMDEELIDHLIQFPAQDVHGRWLWPEVYTEANYAKMRKNAGESAWARNYMQRPTAAGDQTFTDDDLKACSDPLHRIGHKPTHIEGLTGAIIGWDPGFGKNAFYVGGITKAALVDLDWRVDTVESWHQAAQILDDLCAHWQRQGVYIAHLVLEDKAYQHGLLTDESVLAVKRKYGFSLSGHQTGSNKLDEDIGIPSMARSFRMGEIIMPGADDPDTQRARAAMDAELRSWRPHKRGSKLRQDLVMARWFAWIRWTGARQIATDRSHIMRRESVVRHPTPMRPIAMMTGGRR